jgi:hypothetical protein
MRRHTLDAVCDTFAPSLRVDDHFDMRSASDLGVAAQIEGLLAQTAMPEEIEALGQLLDAIGGHDRAGWAPIPPTR